MKEILRKDWPYLLLAVVLIILSILSIDSFKYGFNTAYDQAYMLLKLQEAYDGSFITGKSQWNLLAIHLFPYLDLTNKASSFLAANILNWITILVGTLTACVLFDKRRFLMYFAIIFLVYFQNANHGQGLSYVPMQGAFLCWALCFFMLFSNVKNMAWKYVYAFLTGLSLSISCFTILPGAIVVSVCVFGLVILMHYKTPLQMWKYLLSGIGGAVAVLIFVHFAVCPLNDIIDAMIETSKFFTKGCRYDGGNMFLMYAFFIRDFMFMVVSFIGIYWLSKKFDNKIIGKLFYIIFSVAFVYYCNKLNAKIHIEAFMAIATIAFIPYLFPQESGSTKIEWKNPRTYYYAFLFIFPVIAVFGTNTGVVGRLYSYVIVWLFLFFVQTNKIQRDKYGELLVTVMLFFVIPCAASMNSSIPVVMKESAKMKNTNTCYFERGNKNFAKTAITPVQNNYFQKIDTILTDYNYKPHQSTIFAMVYDYVNIYVFDAVNASYFHAVEYFPYMDVSEQEAPDFLFICRMDSMYIDKYLRATHWNWPEAYDEYSVGCPEDLRIPAWYNIPDINKRYLYCRKSLKKQ